MITIEDFQVALSSLVQLLPRQRTLEPDALVTAWSKFPERAKIDLTDEILLYAVQQRFLDPEPSKELPIHLNLLRYCYPVNRIIHRERGEELIFDQPMCDRGLRRDLAQRMAAPDQFHEPGPVRQELLAPTQQPQLPAGSTQWHPDHLTPEQRRAHVQGVAAAVTRLRARGMDSRAWRPELLAQGYRFFERALQGFWPMECDDGGIAAAWVLRNGSRADQLIQAALDGTAAAAPAEGLVAGFVGAR
jgi:hypothetical protein